MPIIGVLCGMDDSPQTFETCIHHHENRSSERNCHCPIAVLKSMRDNHIDRKGAGISASTLIACPRAVAIEQKYDIYMPVISGWSMGRGTFVHAMMEAERDPPPWVVKEQRVERTIDDVTVTGKPDEVDTKYKVLVDYKSKDNLPKKTDERHEFQFNIYAWLLRGGVWQKSDETSAYPIVKGEAADIHVETIAAHYITWKTKKDLAWKKMRYPVWTDEYTSDLISERLKPLTNWKEHGIIPQCSPYVMNKYWTCDCQKYEAQLAERGITVEDNR